MRMSALFVIQLQLRFSNNNKKKINIALLGNENRQEGITKGIQARNYEIAWG